VTTLFSLTFVLGALFMGLEFYELSRLVASGYSWTQSAFLSAYFTLIGTHGLHVLFGLLWIPILLALVWRDGLNPVSMQRLRCLTMFWQFITVVWLFIFGVVYLVGGLV
jgi:cytochrome o ubiquinol oxidase subunit 3